MPVIWTEFVDKVKHWADRESNKYNVKFSVEFLDEETIKIVASKNNKTCKLKYTKEAYYKARARHSDKDILPILFQILKEKYKPVRWSVVGGKRGESYAWPITS